MSRTRYIRPGAWQADLVALSRRGLSDSAVARELTRRHAPLVFTRRMVFHHRVELVEKQGGRLGEDCASLTEAQRNARRVYQLSSGLGDLLPDYVEPVAGGWVEITHPDTGKTVRVWAAWQHGGYGGGHELTRRECDVLALLLEAGRPLSRTEIARRLGVCPQAIRRHGQPSVLDRLLERGLIVLRHDRGATPVRNYQRSA